MIGAILSLFRVHQQHVHNPTHQRDQSTKLEPYIQNTILMKSISLDRQNDIVCALKQGRSTRAIAASHGVSKGTITRVKGIFRVKCAKTQSRARQNQNARKMTASLERRLVRSARKSRRQPLTELAVDHNICEDTARQYLKRRGVPKTTSDQEAVSERSPSKGAALGPQKTGRR